jgi:hypothetical protein
MIKDQPRFRLQKIEKQCKRTGISLIQALSLRRHHLKSLNPYQSMTQLKLGKEADIRESARLFEHAVQEYLTNRDIAFWTEEEQKKRFQQQVAEKQQGELRLIATPDFLLQHSFVLKRVHKKQTLQELEIHWMEAKMFYAASSIKQNKHNGAVGNLMASAKKYVALFGPGAMIFMYGCGDRLAAELWQVGVIALDCSGTTVALRMVQEHQRTWCANDQGVILP